MNKADADKVKSSFNHPVNYRDCIGLMTQQDVDSCIKNLDLFKTLFELEINDYSLDDTHDLIDEESEIIVRAFWFSKGMEDYFVCIRGDGLFKYASEGIPYELLMQVSEAMGSMEQEV